VEELQLCDPWPEVGYYHAGADQPSLREGAKGDAARVEKDFEVPLVHRDPVPAVPHSPGLRLNQRCVGDETRSEVHRGKSIDLATTTLYNVTSGASRSS
jgi:hypothetical protein